MFLIVKMNISMKTASGNSVILDQKKSCEMVVFKEKACAFKIISTLYLFSFLRY